MSPANKRRKNTGGVKFLIASLSFASAIVIWSMLSARDQVAQVMSANENQVDAGSQSQNIELLLPPLPTLIPLQLIDGEVLGTVVQNPQQSAELRSVSQPQQSVQQVGSGPIIVSRNGGSGGATSSGGGGGSVTTTKSS